MRIKGRFYIPKSYVTESRVADSKGAPAKRRSTRMGHRKKSSDYGLQLKEKQKIKFSYGLREKNFLRHVRSAEGARGDSSAKLLQELESRLDSAVFRLGFASERSSARQIVSHGHILVNGRKVTVPSYQLKKEDIISIRPQSMGKGIFKDLDIKLKKYTPPSWLSLDKESHKGEVKGVPSLEEEGMKPSMDSILEFYSR
ncbi:MAG TPA: 30S ribosomal protein S4 [Candidatus Paceibacterota bacterium]